MSTTASTPVTRTPPPLGANPRWCEWDEDGFLIADGVPLDTPLHEKQALLLEDALTHYWQAELEYRRFYIARDIYYDFAPTGAGLPTVRGPDLLVVRDVEPGRRRNWVESREGKGPALVVEVCSRSSRVEDVTQKKLVYEQYAQVPEYFWCDPETGDYGGFRRVGGRYVDLAPDVTGRIYSQELGVSFGPWEGVFRSEWAAWVRWWHPEGRLLPTLEEALRAEGQEDRARASAAEALAAAERAERVAAQERAEQLTARLRALGIDLD